LNLVIVQFTATGCHNWTTLCPSDRSIKQENVHLYICFVKPYYLLVQMDVKIKI